MTLGQYSTVRKLKKYPNRRLYDTEKSAYITLDDVKTLVLKHEDFQVVDSKTGADITRSILMQIISEQESSDGTPIFSNKMLQNLIRFYGDSLQNVMGEYLEKSLSVFMEQQDILRSQLQSVINANPIKQISHFAERNIPIIKSKKTKSKTKLETRSKSRKSQSEKNKKSDKKADDERKKNDPNVPAKPIRLKSKQSKSTKQIPEQSAPKVVKKIRSKRQVSKKNQSE